MLHARPLGVGNVLRNEVRTPEIAVRGKIRRHFERMSFRIFEFEKNPVLFGFSWEVTNFVRSKRELLFDMCYEVANSFLDVRFLRTEKRQCRFFARTGINAVCEHEGIIGFEIGEF